MRVVHGVQPTSRGAPTVHSSCSHWHWPQSEHQRQSSKNGSHTPSPHSGQAPQSASHEKQLSTLPSQTPSPHTGQAPQSASQLRQSSSQKHTPSPQYGQGPQSAPQLEQDSPGSQ